jgi:hypothetical protein
MVGDCDGLSVESRIVRIQLCYSSVTGYMYGPRGVNGGIRLQYSNNVYFIT